MARAQPLLAPPGRRYRFEVEGLEVFEASYVFGFDEAFDGSQDDLRVVGIDFATSGRVHTAWLGARRNLSITDQKTGRAIKVEGGFVTYHGTQQGVLIIVAGDGIRCVES